MHLYLFIASILISGLILGIYSTAKGRRNIAVLGMTISTIAGIVPALSDLNGIHTLIVSISYYAFLVIIGLTSAWIIISINGLSAVFVGIYILDTGSRGRAYLENVADEKQRFLSFLKIAPLGILVSLMILFPIVSAILYFLDDWSQDGQIILGAGVFALISLILKGGRVDQ